MNVTRTRLLLAVMAVVFLVCAAWLFVGIRTEATGMSVPVTAVGMLCAYVFGVLLVLFGRHFGEATTEEGRVVLRYALAPRRVVPIAEVRSAVYFTNLLLPSRSGTAGARRLVLRLANDDNAFISPRDDAAAQKLESRGVAVEMITDPVTPARARTLAPGSASLTESLIWPLFLGIGLVFPLVAVAFVFITR